ncbi:MAG: CDGSH iron-sulfur domain-containing protein [Gemmatimonadota bacterium]|nr:CDGSH iron-sulfur domain-containing protein [Gemmatimonadota bacterium]
MSEERRRGNVAEVPPGGPLCLSGRIRIEVDGEIVADTDDVALCRCGRSADKPFCDGSHRRVGFDDAGVIRGGRLVPGRDAAGVTSGEPGEEAGFGEAGEPVVIVCAADGPLLVRGPLTVVASDGETSRGVKGALCRCGESSTKPFCDGSHRAAGFAG